MQLFIATECILGAEHASLTYNHDIRSTGFCSQFWPFCLPRCLQYLTEHGISSS